RPLVQWKYSGVVIPLLFGTALSLALASQFVLAYVFFGLFWIWTVAYWLTSDLLQKQRRIMRMRNVRRNEANLHAASRKHGMLKWGGLFLVSIITIGFILWTSLLNAAAREGRKQQARQDVFDHLTVAAYTLPEKQPIQDIRFSVINYGHFKIANHFVDCFVNSLETTNHLFLLGGDLFTHPHSQAMGLLGGGDGETVECLDAMTQGPLICADV